MTSPQKLKVQFAHGLESSPQGSKARLFAQHFDACTPAMNTRDFDSCVRVHAQTLQEFRPDVLVGSSFGGAVAVALLTSGEWRGPTLLLAQAALHYNPSARLPLGVVVTLVHGRQDELLEIEQSRALAATGSPGLVQLIEHDDDHALTGLVESGELVRVVEQLAARARS